ncbi:MAG: thiamine pyrophosphate-dependent dehydrogenase E1 component subunit alpha [Deltaproteobacteria bacterium]|nr:thiamine pyrophosphate-dependent dehydrogenase E1 component subunit alpha [Deltaproteobacteria bacterium]
MADLGVPREILLRLYTNMVRVRTLDEKAIECLFAGKFLTFYHSCQGQEAPGAALCEVLGEKDYLYYNHRSHGFNKCLPRGMSAKELIAEHFGKVTGGARGFAGFHYCAPELGISGMGGMVGGELTLAAGTALACQMRGQGQVVAVCFGDGATGRGTLHEGMLMAAKWKLPVIWFCENNEMAQFTSLCVSHPKENVADFAFGYGIPSAIIDGQDVLAVYRATQEAADRARAGEGPTFLEVKVTRRRGHVEGLPDYSVYCENGLRSAEEVAAMAQRDPIELFRAKLLEAGVLTQDDVARIQQDANREMQEAEQFAAESPYPTQDLLAPALYAD